MKNTFKSLSGNVLTTVVALLFAIVSWTEATARPITRQQAMQQAKVFMQQRGDNHTLSNVIRPTGHTGNRISPNENIAPYYVFNRGEQEGFVIVAGDDALNEDILGYCDSGSFDYDKMPPNMLEWLNDYAKDVEAFWERANGADGASEIHRVPTHPAIAPMVTSRWSQDNPYNQECPEYFTLGKSVTGCVATAYAQIMYYHRSKMVTETQAAMPAYETSSAHETYGHLHVEGIPAGSPIDWDNMIDIYGNNATGIQQKAVAQLMHYCGVAVEMDYTNSSSGAYSYKVADALKNYFGFGNSVQHVSNYSDDDWDQVIYNELSQQRPVYISGNDGEGGHAFVCDGYDGKRHFHINWGWGGSADGFYLLTCLKPGDEQGIGGSGSGYTKYRECIIGIEPENYQERTIPIADATARHFCTEAWDLNHDGKLTYGEAAQVTDLGTVLTGKKITSFNELRYFTALQTIGDDAFNGCQQLTSVQLPRGLKHIGARAFKDCNRLEDLTLPTTLVTIGEEAFSGCTMLTPSALPPTLNTIKAEAFRNCKSLTSITLPAVLSYLGNGAFNGCVILNELTVSSMFPQDMTMGEDVFAGIPLANAVLHIQQGTRPYFENDAQWSQFGTLKEHYNRVGGQFAPLTPNTKVYLYNVGSGQFLSKGEAYGRQAVVNENDPMLFQLRHSASMPEGVYTIYSDETGENRHYTFRTNTDPKVGNGIKATFVDGNLSNQAHWLVSDVGNNTYTFSVPEGYEGYDAARRWGVQSDHESQFTQPTWGVYSDIAYEGNEKNCQWRFIAYDADRITLYETAATLENLVNLAKSRHYQCEDEEAVLYNMESTVDDLRHAQKSLRERMRLIDFADTQVWKICTSNFDLNGDGELSYAEASKIDEIGNYFTKQNITSFDELQYFTSVKDIDGGCFNDCSKLTSITLPESIERIYYWAFRNCLRLTSINLPEYVVVIGEEAFSGCTQLKSVSIANPDPQSINIQNDAFKNVSFKNAVLTVPAGSKELYAAAPVWRNFVNINEMRARTQPKTSPILPGSRGYLMNVATHKFITAGEAYGTQAVVGRKGLLLEWCQTGNTPDNWYFLLNVAENKAIFRTNEDGKVGQGVKACFVDGTDVNKALWMVDSVAENVYTLQTLNKDKDFVEGEYLGTDYEHTTDYTYGLTDGIYWDIVYNGHERQCQWAFVTQEDLQAAKDADKNVEKLNDLLLLAKKKGGIDTAEEQAVYDNVTSSDEDILAAIDSLRHKLHYIDIDDADVKTICIEKWDADDDGELSIEEAAAVEDIGEAFRNQTKVKELSVLRHFTGIQSIPANAFRNASSLATVYLPEQVKNIGEMAFTGCPLRFLVMLNSNDMVTLSSLHGIRKQAVVFVPETLVSTYQASSDWAKNTVTAYTGQPTVTAMPASRAYGRTNPQLSYGVTGAPIDGEPELVCEKMKEPTTPAGDYAIIVMPGTITTEGVELVDGIFTITPAELTVTAKSYIRKQGEENPVFEFTCKGFRNKETPEVFLTQPVITCEATKDSPAGEYPIVISGATAHNYNITFVDGVLTIEEASGIASVTTDGQPATVLYDLQGRRVTDASRRGFYIDHQRRRVVSR